MSVSESESLYGLLAEGFVRKPFSVIIEEMQEVARQTFGPDVDLRPQSPVRNWIEISAIEIDRLWGLAEQEYYSQFISTADDDALDLHGEPLGATRKRLLKAVGNLAFRSSGASLVTIGSDTVVETSDGVQFSTDELLTIEKGTIDIPKELGEIVRSSSGDPFPQPFDLNTSLTVINASSLSGSRGIIFIESDDSNSEYSFGYYDNVVFIPKSSIDPRAKLDWISPARTLIRYYTYDSSATSFINRTNETDPKMFNDGDGGQNDAIYIGGNNKFSRITFVILTALEAAAGITVEYFGSSGWTTLTSIKDGTNDGSGFLRQTGIIIINWLESEWNDWITTSEGGLIETAYYIKITLTTTISSPNSFDGTPGITLDNGVIPTIGTAYYVGVIGNQWDHVVATALIGGTSGNVNALSISNLLKAVSGVTQVLNQNTFSGGVDTETSASYRNRLLDRPRSFFSGDYIQAAIEGISGIETVVIEEGRKEDTITVSGTVLTPSFTVDSYDGIFTSKSTEANDPNVTFFPFNSGAVTEYVMFGALIKFTRVFINISTNLMIYGGTIGTIWEYWNGTAWVAFNNAFDDTDDGSGPLRQDGSFILQMSAAEFANWKATDFGGTFPLERFYMRLRLTGTGNVTNNGKITQVFIFNESVSIRKAALDPGARNGITRVSVFRPSTGKIDVIPSESAKNFPELTSPSQFWADYRNPTRVVLYSDVLMANDIVTVDYIDAAVGSAFYNAVVLPTSSPLDDALSTNIFTELSNLTPIGVGFKIVEATSLIINVSGTLIYDTVNFDLSDLNNNIFNRLFNNYFRNLKVGEIVYRNKVLQFIMEEAGIIDVQELILNIVGEVHEGSSTSVDLDVAKIHPFVGSGVYGTTIQLDIDGNEIFGEISNSEGEGELTEESESLASTTSIKRYKIELVGESKGTVIWDNTGSWLGSNVVWKITYFSAEGNLDIPQNSIAKLGTVNFS